MEFLTTQVPLPLWLVILMLAGMTPFFIRMYRIIKRVKGRLKRDDVIIDSTMKTISPFGEEGSGAKKSKRSNEVKILKLLAIKGDQGMLLQSIADSLRIDSNTTSHALKYLEGKKMVEVITAMGGDKYYLTQLGKNYCSKKGYKKNAA